MVPSVRFRSVTEGGDALCDSRQNQMVLSRPKRTVCGVFRSTIGACATYIVRLELLTRLVSEAGRNRMDSNSVKSKATLKAGKISGEPRTSTTTRRNDDGTMTVEVVTVFEVVNPDEVFSLKGSGITMSLEAQN